MPSIQELLENLGVEDSEKTANTCSDKEIEKAAEELGLISKTDNESTIKVASQENGGNMNLQDLYEAYFDGTEKTASVKKPRMEKTAAQELEAAGEKAGRVFSESLSGRLFKFAMEQAMESSATEDRDGSSASAIPGATPASPQLEQNKPEEAKDGHPMDTTPQYYDLLDKAVAKAVLLNALEENDTEEVEGVSQTDVIGEENSVTTQQYA